MVPEGFWHNLQVALLDYQGAAADAKMVSTSTGNVMPWPTSDPTAYLASLQGAELTQLSIDTSWVFGQGTLGAYTYACPPVLVSHQLATDSAFDVGAFLAQRFAEGIGRKQSYYFINGSGSSQPQGIVAGLTAKGAVSTGSGGFLDLTAATPVQTFADPDGSATTELNSNSLAPQTIINMIKSVDRAYRQNGCKFYLNDAQLAGMRNVVDLNGRPILQDPAHESGEPTLYGYPVVVDNNVADLTASTVGGPMFGNMSVAMVERRVNGIEVQRLTERWADFLAVGYLAWMRSDFRCNDLRAAIIVKPAAT
jgi:HK97 family phage major capsid protein